LGAGISWKLLIYVLAFAMIGATSYGLYRKITEKTTTTNYRNEVSRAQTVTIDQTQIVPEPRYVIRLQILGFDAHLISLAPKVTTTINNNKVEVTPIVAPVVPVKKKTNKILLVAEIISIGTVIVVGVHYIVKAIKAKIVTSKPKGL
jgi:hypothetical protein